MLDLGISAILTILAVIILIKVTGKILKIVLTLALVGGIVYFVSSFITSGFTFANFDNLVNFARLLSLR
ncbi:MAG: hypothetical protein IJW64_01930 [Clostridia bacterium]|nr:hypothetical protein [Clostridia bacterium]